MFKTLVLAEGCSYSSFAQGGQTSKGEHHRCQLGNRSTLPDFDKKNTGSIYGKELGILAYWRVFNTFPVPQREVGAGHLSHIHNPPDNHPILHLVSSRCQNARELCSIHV